MIKIRKHFVTNGEFKARVRYSLGKIINDNRECVTLYEKDYERNLLKIFKEAKNDSDPITDYFEKTKVRIFEDNPLFKEALKYAN